MPPDRSDGELADVFPRMSRALLSRETVQTVLQLLAALIQETLPGTTGAGVTLVDAAGRRTAAASDPVAEQADALQYELDEGPCLTAWRDRQVVRIDDLEQDRRWPRWSGPAARLGLRSVLSTPLLAGPDTPDTLGAIKAYSSRPGVYGPHDAQVLRLFADQAAVLLADVQSPDGAGQDNARLRAALRDRDLIGQAKGLLIGRGAADGEAAYAMLVSASQRSHDPVHEVARKLLASATAGPEPERHGG